MHTQRPSAGTPPVQPSATGSRLRIVPLQESPPRLRLETLTAHQVEFVLCITYASVILAAVLALVERQAYVYDDVSISALPSWDSGCTAGPSAHTACLADNSTWWADGREYINATTTPLELSINYTNRFFKLHANLSTRTFDGRINETFAAPVQMVANVTAYSSEYQRWIPVANVSSLHWLHCYHGRVGCEPLTLYELDVIDYTRYSLNLTFNNSNLPELARDQNLTMSFVFSFMNPDFAVGQLVARGTLCAITVIVIVLYSISLCTAHMRPLPEQQWVRGALLLVVLFQDPGLFLRFLMGGSSARASSALAAIAAPTWLTNDVQTVYLASLFMHYFAVLGLFFFWAMMLHSVGLPAPGDEARMLQEKLDRASEGGAIASTTTASGNTVGCESHLSGSTRPCLSGAATDNGSLKVPLISSASSSIEADGSNSNAMDARQQAKGYPWSFYAPKLAAAIAMWLGLVASWAYFPTYSWAFASELRGTGADSEDDERALVALYMAFRVCTGIYFLWFVFAFNRAYRRLRALPYLETRFRQLSFHFFVFHGSWVIAFIIITYIWQSLRPASALSDEDTFSPDSKCLLCTVYLCVLAFVYSPAPRDASFAGADRQLHVNKTAWLLEIAVHSYADSSHQPQRPESPQVPTTLSGDRPGSRGELWELGLQHEAFLHDSETDTTVLVASEPLALARARGRRRRLVVAFRGTKSRENFKTDFDFLPVAIDLKDTGRPLRVDGCNRTSSVESRSSSDSNSDEDVEEDPLSIVGGAGRRCGGYGGCVCGCCCCCCPAWLLPNMLGLGGLLKPRAHRGFWRAYRTVSPELRRQLRNIVSRMQEEGQKFSDSAEAQAAAEGKTVSADAAAANSAAQGVELLVVGHSLGGALANICALDIGGTLFRQQTRTWQQRLARTISRSTEVLTATMREIGQGLHIAQPHSQPLELSQAAHLEASAGVELGLYTFGAPRVGNHRFGSLLLRAVGGLGQVWRVVCLRDLVVDVNPACLGYAHCGTEVVIDSRGNCVLMPSVVERVFRPRRNALVDHYLDAYTTAFDALMARHSHIDSLDGNSRSLHVLGLRIEEDEKHDGQECDTPDANDASRSLSLRGSLAFTTSPRRSTRTLLDASVEVLPEANVEPEPELEPELEAELEPEPQPQVEAEAESQVQHGLQPKLDSDLRTDLTQQVHSLTASETLAPTLQGRARE